LALPCLPVGLPAAGTAEQPFLLQWMPDASTPSLLYYQVLLSAACCQLSLINLLKVHGGRQVPCRTYCWL
jgi:hypothetical protein